MLRSTLCNTKFLQYFQQFSYTRDQARKRLTTFFFESTPKAYHIFIEEEAMNSYKRLPSNANIVAEALHPTSNTHLAYSLTKRCRPPTPTPASHHYRISDKIKTLVWSGVAICSLLLNTLAFLCLESTQTVAMIKLSKPLLYAFGKMSRVRSHQSRKQSCSVGTTTLMRKAWQQRCQTSLAKTHWTRICSALS